MYVEVSMQPSRKLAWFYFAAGGKRYINLQMAFRTWDKKASTNKSHSKPRDQCWCSERQLLPPVHQSAQNFQLDIINAIYYSEMVLQNTNKCTFLKTYLRTKKWFSKVGQKTYKLQFIMAGILKSKDFYCRVFFSVLFWWLQ